MRTHLDIQHIEKCSLFYFINLRQYYKLFIFYYYYYYWKQLFGFLSTRLTRVPATFQNFCLGVPTAFLIFLHVFLSSLSREFSANFVASFVECLSPCRVRFSYTIESRPSCLKLDKNQKVHYSLESSSVS